MPPAELHPLETMLSRSSNAALVNSGSHLLHVAENGLDLSALARRTEVPDEVVSYCTRFLNEAEGRTEDVCADGQQAWFTADFGFRRRLEDAFEDIRKEWLSLPRDVQ